METNSGAPRPTYPAGITGFNPMPYGYRRWNGAVWADIQVDAYNRQLREIETMHNAGYDRATQSLIDGLYNLAHGFDAAGKPPVNATHAPDDRALTDWKIGGAL